MAHFATGAGFGFSVEKRRYARHGHTGPAHYDGLETLLAMPGVSPFFYGKAQTRPGRKMGHVTVLDESVEALREKAETVRKASES